MTKYQTKPRTVEAVQWTGDNLEEVREVFPDVEFTPRADGLLAAFGSIMIFPLWWFVKGDGWRSITDDDFRADYEATQ